MKQSAGKEPTNSYVMGSRSNSKLSSSNIQVATSSQKQNTVSQQLIASVNDSIVKLSEGMSLNQVDVSQISREQQSR